MRPALAPQLSCKICVFAVYFFSPTRLSLPRRGVLCSLFSVHCSLGWRQPPSRSPGRVNALVVLLRSLVAFQENAETQGMGTVVRPEGLNGEVPRPLRSFRVFVETVSRAAQAAPGRLWYNKPHG